MPKNKIRIRPSSQNDSAIPPGSSTQKADLTAPNPFRESLRQNLDQALISPFGLTLTFNSSTDARAYRMAIYAFLKSDRRANAKTYPSGHPSHGTSAYDDLTFRTHGANLIIKLHQHPLPLTVTTNSNA